MRTGPSTGLWVVRAAQSGTIWQELAGFKVAWRSATGVTGRRCGCHEMSRNVAMTVSDLSVVAVVKTDVKHWQEYRYERRRDRGVTRRLTEHPCLACGIDLIEGETWLRALGRGVCRKGLSTRSNGARQTNHARSDHHGIQGVFASARVSYDWFEACDIDLPEGSCWASGAKASGAHVRATSVRYGKVGYASTANGVGQGSRAPPRRKPRALRRPAPSIL